MNKVTHGTTNVFADLGYTDAGERQVKTRLALAINDLLKGRKLKQREIAEILGVLQPKVSALENYRFDQFSIEKLMVFFCHAESRRGNHDPAVPYHGGVREHFCTGSSAMALHSVRHSRANKRRVAVMTAMLNFRKSYWPRGLAAVDATLIRVTDPRH